jgi:hypothetical protein
MSHQIGELQVMQSSDRFTQIGLLWRKGFDPGDPIGRVMDQVNVSVPGPKQFRALDLPQGVQEAANVPGGFQTAEFPIFRHVGIYDSVIGDFVYRIDVHVRSKA